MSESAANTPIGRGPTRASLAGVVVVAGFAVLIGFAPGGGLGIQSAWFDALQRLRPRDIASTPVTVVAIDERSLARLGQWPWPRTVLADVIGAVARQRPAAIGVDILMPEPDRLSPDRLLARARREDPVLSSRLDALPSNDNVLARAITAAPVVLGVAGTSDGSGKEPLAPPFLIIDRAAGSATAGGGGARVPRFAGALMNIDELARAAAGHGAVSAGPTNTVIRRIPLVVRIADRLVPSMAIEMLRVALGAPEIRMHVRGRDVEAIGVGDLVVPTEADGGLRIYYSERDSRRFLSAIDVLDGAVDPLRLQQKLVLISTTGLAIVDYQTTPLGVPMPGSEIHAQLLENLYDQTWLIRPMWAIGYEVALFLLLGLLLVSITPRWKPGHVATLALGCLGIPFAAAIVAFLRWRYLLDAATPALCLLLVFGLLLVLTLAEASRQRRALEQTIQAQRERAARTAGELEAAKRIQTGFLPRADLLDDDRRIEVAATMDPAREVGGDLYDYFRLDDRRLFFLIGDVAGKGLSASVFMAVSKALCKSATLRNPDATIDELMRAANEEVSRDNPEMLFVTAFAGVLDLESGDLAYCNAGHENPFRLRLESTSIERVIDGGGPPLCAVDRFDYRGGVLRMERNETLVLVTDGVIDAQNPDAERYGGERLLGVLARVRETVRTPRALVDAVRRDVLAFAAGAEPIDDVTVLALQWIGPSARD